MAIRFALLKRYEECAYFNELTRRIWGSGADDDIPIHVLVTIAKNGGGVLVAYADDGPADLQGMIGMALWWLGTQTVPGISQPQLKICSHMAGVLPQWQRLGVGAQLKLKQREIVLAQGLTDWMTWTYDPLYRANGVFNVHRLGAVCNSYFRNVYGELNDDLNRGTPSDRCQVDWWLRSERAERAAQGELPNGEAGWADLHVQPSTLNAEGLRQPGEPTTAPTGAALAIPIPDDIGLIRRHDPGLGHAWRMYIREQFEAAFAAGYTIVDCVKLPDQGWHYLLTIPKGA